MGNLCGRVVSRESGAGLKNLSVAAFVVPATEAETGDTAEQTTGPVPRLGTTVTDDDGAFEIPVVTGSTSPSTMCGRSLSTTGSSRCAVRPTWR
jgi:hypothetical protein